MMLNILRLLPYARWFVVWVLLVVWIFQPAVVCVAEPLEMTLDEVIIDVLRYNHDIEQARLQWLTSDHVVYAAAGAFEPDVVGNLGKSKLERENSTLQLLEQGGLGEFSQKDKKYGVGIEGALSSGGNYHIGYDLDKQRSNLSPKHEYVSFAGITVEQPLLRGAWFGSATAPVRIARQDRAVAFQKYRKEIMSVVLRAESRYWSLVFAQEDYRIARDSVEIAEKILRDARQRLETGAMSNMDVETAQAELAVRQAQAEETRQNLLDALTQLKLLLGNERVPAEQAIHATDTLLPVEEELQVTSEARGDILAQAYLEQPDLLASLEELKKEDVSLTQRRDRLLPQLNLKGSYGYNGLGDSEEQAWYKLKEEDFPSWSMGVETRIPLFCGVTERHELAAARLQRQAASQRVQATKQEIANSIDELLQTIDSCRNRLENARLVSGIKQHALTVEMSHLEAGKSEIRNVCKAEEDAAAARRRELEAIVRLRETVRQLTYVRGLTLRCRGLEKWEGNRIALDKCLLDKTPALMSPAAINWRKRAGTTALCDLLKARTLTLEFSFLPFQQGVVCTQALESAVSLAKINILAAAHPEDAAVYNQRGLLYLALDDYRRAVVDFNRAIRRQNDFDAAFVNRGVAFLRMKKFRQALADFNNALSINSLNAEAYANRAIIYLERNETERAAREFGKSLEVDKRLAEAQNGLGVVLARLGEIRQAQEVFSRACTAEPEYAPAHYNRASLLAQEGKYAEALAEYDTALRLQPNLSNGYINRGMAYAQMHKFHEAIADLDKAVSLSPTYAFAYHVRAIILCRMGNAAAAITDFKRVLELDPSFAQIYYNHGILFSKEGVLTRDYASAYNNRGIIFAGFSDWKASHSDFDQALSMNADFAAAYSNRAVVQALQGGYTQAVAGALQALKLDRQCSAAMNNIGFIYARQGNISKARAAFYRATRLPGAGAASFSNYAALLGEEGHQEQAQAAFDQALRLEPGHIAALVNRGLFHARRSEHEAALADYARSLSGKETAQAYNNRGVLRSRQGQWNEAVADFDKAIEIDAGLSVVWNNRALAYAHTGSMREAMQDMDKAIVLSPKDAQLYAGRGFLYLRTNALTQARQDFCQAWTYNPNLFTPLEKAADFNRRSLPLKADGGSKPTVSAYRFRERSSLTRFTVCYGMGVIALQEQRFADALSQFESAMRIRSDFAPLYADMASCYERNGDVVKTLRLYRQAAQRLLPWFNAPAHVLIADRLMERFRSDNSVFRPQITWLSSTEYLLADDTDTVSVCMRELQAQMPADALGYTRRGLVQMTMGNTKEALAQFDAALRSDVHFVPAYINRGTLHCRLGNMAAGLGDYKTALALDPINAVAHFNYGLLLEQEGKVVQAVSAYEKAVAGDPNLVVAYLNLTVLYGKQGELTLAYKNCQKVISLQPANAIAYNNRAILHERMGDYAAAQEDFSQAIMRAPNTAIILANRGATHNAIDAAADFSRALALDPSCAPAYNNRALWHAARSEYTSAARDLSAGIACALSEADIYFNNGIVALKTGRLQESVTLFSRAVELDEHTTNAYYYRGIAYACILLLEQSAQVNRGFLYEHERLWTSAMSDLARALNLQPNFTQAYVWQSILYLYHNELEPARQAVEASMSMARSAAAYCVRGVIYFKKDFFSAACPMFDRAVDMDEQMLCAIALKACAYEKLQDKKRALLTYQTLVYHLLPKDLELKFFLQETPLWEYEFISEEQNSLLPWK